MERPEESLKSYCSTTAPAIGKKGIFMGIGRERGVSLVDGKIKGERSERPITWDGETSLSCPIVEGTSPGARGKGTTSTVYRRWGSMDTYFRTPGERNWVKTPLQVWEQIGEQEGRKQKQGKTLQ